MYFIDILKRKTMYIIYFIALKKVQKKNIFKIHKIISTNILISYTNFLKCFKTTNVINQLYFPCFKNEKKTFFYKFTCKHY